MLLLSDPCTRLPQPAWTRPRSRTIWRRSSKLSSRLARSARVVPLDSDGWLFLNVVCKEFLDKNEDDDYARQLLQHAKKQKDPLI